VFIAREEQMISRRDWLLKTSPLLLNLVSNTVFSKNNDTNDEALQPSQRERQVITKIANEFIKKTNSPGFSIAFAYKGHFVLQDAFGHADLKRSEKLTVDHTFRIASVAKPITSTAIFLLIQQGKLRLDDYVFKKDGVLGHAYGVNISDNLAKIKIIHLLTHEAGGWANDRNDPMFLNTDMSQHDLIEWTLKNQPLRHVPGTTYAYSNFGYCLLGRVIEKISGKRYQDFIKTNIFNHCEISSAFIGRNTMAQKGPNEVQYFGQNGDTPYFFNVSRMDSHGGWVCTPTDLVRFANHVDGHNNKPSVISLNMIQQMTKPSPVNRDYASGWSVNAQPNWWHNGSLPGTTSIMVRTASQFCWAGILNTRNDQSASDLDDVMWKIAKSVAKWKP
jgi:CubicO group peptidase (beta-lactamase class C family)